MNAGPRSDAPAARPTPSGRSLRVLIGTDTYPSDVNGAAYFSGSAVRRSAFGGAEPRFLAQICWRFIAKERASTGWTARLGSQGRTFLTVSLGESRIHCYAAINSATPPPDDWRVLFADFAAPVAELLEQATGAYFAPLFGDRLLASPILIADRGGAGGRRYDQRFWVAISTGRPDHLLLPLAGIRHRRVQRHDRGTTHHRCCGHQQAAVARNTET